MIQIIVGVSGGASLLLGVVTGVYVLGMIGIGLITGLMVYKQIAGG